MESYSSLIDAFAALNRRKRDDPESLSSDEQSDWKQMRRELELALFNHTVDAANDTREFLRVPTSLSVRYWTSNELKDRYIPVLGEGGLMVSTVDPLPLGTDLDLEIVLAHKRVSFHVRGEVVWVKQGDDPATSGMGIRFLDLSYEQKRLVYGLVDDTLRERLLERRRFARVDAQLHVEFVYADGIFELQTEDVSLGGVFIATEHLLPAGERLRLVLHIPGRGPAVKAVAEVARVVDETTAGSPAGLGVRFVDISDNDRQALMEFLAQRIATEEEPGQKSEGTERRRHARMEQRIKLRFQSLNALGVSYSKDISSGGVFIQTMENPPPMGSDIEVTLIHPVNLQPLVLPGRVVRVIEAEPDRPDIPAGVGVQFGQLPVEQREQLQEFLTYYVQFDQETGSDPATDSEALAGAGAVDDEPPDSLF